jgi:DNA-binding NarL/FixJ family response regulator
VSSTETTIERFRHGPNDTERRIALAVALGRSNREIAEALELSVKTVEWNLTKLYRKHHVRSRTELALKIHGLGPTTLEP